MGGRKYGFRLWVLRRARMRGQGTALAITRNRALSMLRRRPMERLDGSQAEAIVDRADDPEVAIQKQQQSAILADCLTKLSPAHREVIDLVYYRGRSTDEVAAITGVPASTVKTRMFYARKRLAKLLNPYGFGQSPPPTRASACRRRARAPRSASSVIRGSPTNAHSVRLSPPSGLARR
jgi:RNA polymerase sigma factor (sigma-70 family)